MGRWYRQVLGAAERFMARWHVEGKKSSERCAARMRHAQAERGAGGSRETPFGRKQEGGGRQQSSKAPGRLVGRVSVYVTPSYCENLAFCVALVTWIACAIPLEGAASDDTTAVLRPPPVCGFMLTRFSPFFVASFIYLYSPFVSIALSVLLGTIGRY